MKAIETKHLSEQLGYHMCTCGQPATRLVRCKVCRTVIARCTGCGENMHKLQLGHCAGSATR
jgi:hypothetical protein